MEAEQFERFIKTLESLEPSSLDNWLTLLSTVISLISVVIAVRALNQTKEMHVRTEKIQFENEYNEFINLIPKFTERTLTLKNNYKEKRIPSTNHNYTEYLEEFIRLNKEAMGTVKVPVSSSHSLEYIQCRLKNIDVLHRQYEGGQGKYLVESEINDLLRHLRYTDKEIRRKIPQ